MTKKKTTTNAPIVLSIDADRRAFIRQMYKSELSAGLKLMPHMADHLRSIPDMDGVTAEVLKEFDERNAK